MPYKSEKIRIQGTKYDRRRKLTEDDKINIIKFSAEVSIHGLARMYNVDRRTIQFILYPERHKHSLELREARGGWKLYHDPDAQRKSVKEHRAYKHKLYKEGLIK